MNNQINAVRDVTKSYVERRNLQVGGFRRPWHCQFAKGIVIQGLVDQI